MWSGELGFVQVIFEAASPIVDAEDNDLPCGSAHFEQDRRAPSKADGPQPRSEIVTFGSAFQCLGKAETKALDALNEAKSDVMTRTRRNVVVDGAEIRFGGLTDDDGIRFQPRDFVCFAWWARMRAKTSAAGRPRLRPLR